MPSRPLPAIRIPPKNEEQHLLRESPAMYLPTLSLPLEPEMLARLTLAARERRSSLEALAVRLLDLGLTREAGRSQAEAALEMLTPREREVARLTAVGRTNGQIAAELFISQETVKTHVRNALIKFGVKSRSDLRLLLQELGIQLESG